MELTEFINEVFCLSHLEETRIYAKRFIGANGQNVVYKKLVSITEKKNMRFFEFSKSNKELIESYGIGQDEVEKYILTQLRPECILTVVENRSNTFKTDNDELYLCGGFVELDKLHVEGKDYSGLANDVKLLHFYFKFGFQDGGKKAVVVSFHKMNVPEDTNFYYKNKAGKTDFFFDDSLTPNPTYGLLKDYVSKWVGKTARRKDFFKENFTLDFSDKALSKLEIPIRYTGDPNNVPSDDFYEDVIESLKVLRFRNLYYIKRIIRYNNDIILKIEINKGDIEKGDIE